MSPIVRGVYPKNSIGGARCAVLAAPAVTTSPACNAGYRRLVGHDGTSASGGRTTFENAIGFVRDGAPAYQEAAVMDDDGLSSRFATIVLPPVASGNAAMAVQCMIAAHNASA